MSCGAAGSFRCTGSRGAKALSLESAARSVRTLRAVSTPGLSTRAQTALTRTARAGCRQTPAPAGSARIGAGGMGDWPSVTRLKWGWGRDRAWGLSGWSMCAEINMLVIAAALNSAP